MVKSKKSTKSLHPSIYCTHNVQYIYNWSEKVFNFNKELSKNGPIFASNAFASFSSDCSFLQGKLIYPDKIKTSSIFHQFSRSRVRVYSTILQLLAYIFCRRGGSSSPLFPEIFHYFQSHCLVSELFTERNAGFKPGSSTTSASAAWSASNQPLTTSTVHVCVSLDF